MEMILLCLMIRLFYCAVIKGALQAFPTRASRTQAGSLGRLVLQARARAKEGLLPTHKTKEECIDSWPDNKKRGAGEREKRR